jgi:hypothetical protein
MLVQILLSDAEFSTQWMPEALVLVFQLELAL